MAENERREKLQESIKKFNKINKEEIFTMGNEIEELPVVASGISVIDDFIGGGFKKGGHTIVYGPYSVGKTALILQTIANAQKNELLVCYVNNEKPIGPERFKFFGVDLDELVYIEAPENAEQALEAMRTLCKDKVIDLFIIDSINGLCPKSVQEDKSGKERSLTKKNVASLPLTLSNFYNIVNTHVFKSKASVIWIGQTRTQGIGGFFVHQGLSGGKAQEFYAYQILYIRKDQKDNAPVRKIKEYFVDPDGKVHFRTIKEPCGFGVVMKLTKTNSSKSKRENSEISVPYLYDKGFVSEVIEEEVIPIVFDVKNDEEKKIIEDYIIEKKPDDAKQLGLNKILNMVEEEIEGLSKVMDVTEAKEEIKEIKKKRGRPKGKKK